MPNPSQELPACFTAQNEDLYDMDVLCTFKSKIKSQNLDMGVPKTSDYIHIKIKIPNPSQEPPVSLKDPSDDLKDMDVLCTFKIRIESHNSDHG